MPRSSIMPRRIKGLGMLPDYLRELALRCRVWSRDSFDLKAAERLRLVADELTAKAEAVERTSANGVSIRLLGTEIPFTHRLPEVDGESG
jgi:hypothetical protein